MNEQPIKVDSKSDIILLLLKDNPIGGITRLEKLIFLLLEKGNFKKKLKNAFNFKPFRMGPFSSDVYDQIIFLKSINLLKTGKSERDVFEDSLEEENLETDVDSETSNGIFRLTKNGNRISEKLFKGLNDEEIKFLKKIRNFYSKLSLTELLRYIYKKYEKMTTESEIKNLIRDKHD